MGYYTHFELNITPKPTKEENLEITSMFGDFFGYEATIKDTCNSILNNFGEMKWYEHEGDMKDLSEKFPKFLFTLEGEGEESGDIWKEYFKGGKSQRVKAKFTFEDYDEKKLKK